MLNFCEILHFFRKIILKNNKKIFLKNSNICKICKIAFKMPLK